MYTLRPATTADAKLIASIEEQAMRGYAEQTWGYWFPDREPERYFASFEPEFQSIVIMDDCEVGVLEVRELDTQLLLERLYVVAECRNRGIGSALLRSVLDRARMAGKPLHLRTPAVNHRARAFYEKHGLVLTGEDSERAYYASNSA